MLLKTLQHVCTVCLCQHRLVHMYTLLYLPHLCMLHVVTHVFTLTALLGEWERCSVSFQKNRKARPC